MVTLTKTGQRDILPPIISHPIPKSGSTEIHSNRTTKPHFKFHHVICQCILLFFWFIHSDLEPVYSGHPSGPNQSAAYRGGLLIQWNLCIVATPQDPTSRLLYRGGLLIQWNLCIVGCYTVEPVYSGTPQDPTSRLLYRGGLLIQWNLCIVATPQDPTSRLLYRGGLLIQWNLCIVATPQDPTTRLLYRGGLLIQWNPSIVATQPVGIQRWPTHTD